MNTFEKLCQWVQQNAGPDAMIALLVCDGTFDPARDIYLMSADVLALRSEINQMADALEGVSTTLESAMRQIQE